MPRPREHDPEKVRKLALRCFWEKGFSGASMADLSKATGLDGRQFIRDYGSKRGVFVQALHDFSDAAGHHILADLEHGKSGFADIRKTLTRLVDLSGDEACWGCLICSTSQDVLVTADDEIGAIVRAYFSRIQAGYSSALKRAVRHGELDGSGVTQRRLARSLMATHVAILTLQRGGVDTSVLKDIVRQATGTLR